MRIFCLLLCILLGSYTVSSAQINKISQLLASNFLKELKKKEPIDTVQYLSLFDIKNDTLYLSYKIDEPSKSEYMMVVNKVALQDIYRFDKDINVLFVCKDNSVITIETQYNAYTKKVIREKITTSHLFFTGMHSPARNHQFRDKVLKAFRKSKFPITSEFWYD